MKFVVTGTSGVRARSTSRSARKWPSSASELKRHQSSRCEGLTMYGARRGGRTSAQSPYPWLQNVVPQASLSVPRSP